MAPASSRLYPERFDTIGGELAIAWSDGSESFLPLERLRRFCPCAACGGEPDLLHPAVRNPQPPGPDGLRLRRIQPVGNYALQLVWGDGHDTGIYSHAYLRELGARGA